MPAWTIQGIRAGSAGKKRLSGMWATITDYMLLAQCLQA